LATEYDDAGDRLLLRLSDRMLPLMSVNRDDAAAVDRTGVTCLGALLYALDRRSALSSDDNAYDDEDDDDVPTWWWCR